jgi:glycosyltransferase involved in cell wall biosynthesis
MLVSYRTTDDPDVGMIWRTQFWRAADYVASLSMDYLSLQYLLFPSSFRLRAHPWFRESNILQLYNIHGKFFSHTVLPILSKRMPVVWRLSDMWPLTGHCAYSYECERWKSGCGSCPLLHDEPRLRADRTAMLWKTKKWIFDRSRLHVVAPSHWIGELARQSPLLSRFPVHWIPNGVNTQVFKPLGRLVAREALGLSPAERIILFSAVETSDARKGSQLLSETLAHLRAKINFPCRILVVGNHASSWKEILPFPVTPIETLKDDLALSLVYSAADVLMYPALADNLPNGVLESMACGTPVVAFRVGGVSDAVRPGETGYLAPLRDTRNLAEGLGALLVDDDMRVRLSRNCRTVAEQEYGCDLQTRRFEKLYNEIVASS